MNTALSYKLHLTRRKRNTPCFDSRKPVGLVPTARPTLEELSAYRNDAVVDRYRKDLSLSYGQASQLFSDVKRFLWLGSVANGRIAPPPKIDDGWHTFIIFTEDYADFCEQYFGRFRHHRPARPDDSPDGGITLRRTIKAINDNFGPIAGLSRNWEFPILQDEGQCWGTCTVPSTNCQDSE